ncbi:hypothetical protein PHYBLDRAFT_145438 [Phycomyces blakesleeanus NRRL 1555(-)]|uniref:Uncharacterized protein n=1 Tax=Phycomyces blakesleeanus (strain ATCC 8743b / DSM 1359 / FGSC 10004 / NBRC 33097 / NRRL 1555) TaxID=763407 RepID=A0A167MTZ5_PHYB8|nr:hypothetical protein PHYBLDRAFT_145438 [Phycomyces blakesleeanus NRRL 1555(-)]OAD73974.1 hypothetical protein PHYBLDRAFT_145438 [Phycomyces blakesleeanus NRRL 1555(-)]|eukprot:XP_018292014.1 hypothetical protein PHYBLDRAFT_145438 [Phycomyces blakesleeanus NRRL 1555(-)]
MPAVLDTQRMSIVVGARCHPLAMVTLLEWQSCVSGSKGTGEQGRSQAGKSL